MSEPIMEFNITIDPSLVTTVKTITGEGTIIPFGGSVESELFSGHVLPGAADVQTVNAAGIRHMRACYTFEGTDSAGNPCKLFVENNGYFEPGHMPMPFHTVPTFVTDSPVLGDYLHGAHFRTEGSPAPDGSGVIIRVFDTLK